VRRFIGIIDGVNDDARDAGARGFERITSGFRKRLARSAATVSRQVPAMLAGIGETAELASPILLSRVGRRASSWSNLLCRLRPLKPPAMASASLSN
jgi:hypothetical protein